jgi:hypothetical protein
MAFVYGENQPVSRRGAQEVVRQDHPSEIVVAQFHPDGISQKNHSIGQAGQAGSGQALTLTAENVKHAEKIA